MRTGVPTGVRPGVIGSAGSHAAVVIQVIYVRVPPIWVIYGPAFSSDEAGDGPQVRSVVLHNPT